MPPKQRITRDMILEKSFDMFCRDGMSGVNARSVAKALNCSTQPIFSYFSGMDDLKNALDQKARDTCEQKLISYTQGDKVLETCCGVYVTYAIEQPRLFSHMFMRVDDTMSAFGISTVLKKTLIQKESQESEITMEQAQDVFLHTWCYAHGLAALIAAKQMQYTPEQVVGMIHDAHEAALLYARSKQNV